jgi:hypothetical protein
VLLCLGCGSETDGLPKNKEEAEKQFYAPTDTSKIPDDVMKRSGGGGAAAPGAGP